MQRHRLFAIALTVICLLAVISWQDATAAPPVLARVTVVQGKVWVQRSGKGPRVSLKELSPLYEHDKISTAVNSRVHWNLIAGGDGSVDANQTIVMRPPNTEKGRTTVLHVVLGRVLARLRPRQRITAPHDVRIDAEGTVIHLEVKEDGTSILTVVEGEVKFSNPQGLQVVSTSQQSVARPGEPPTPPITLSASNVRLVIEWALDLNRAIIPREKFFITPDRRRARVELARYAKWAAQQTQNATVRRDYGDALFDSGQYTEALREYWEANRLTPEQPGILTRLGYALLELGRLDEDRLEESERFFHQALATTQPLLPVVRPAPIALLGEDSPQAHTLLVATSAEENSARTHSALAGDAQGTAPADVSALVGLAWVELTRDRLSSRTSEMVLPEASETLPDPQVLPGVQVPPGAQEWAEQAVAADGNSAEAHIVLGLSLMRQPGQLEAAQQSFQRALSAQPESYHYQARAWLALCALAQGKRADALAEALAAQRAAPESALAHGNLALVYFFTGEAGQAVREARVATKLNPESIAAQVALGQAQLAQGDVDAAERAAAQAVALDPRLPQAWYLLGVADAQRRDYRHAMRELHDCLRLAPDFLPAASALARVYTLVGRENDAETLLTDLRLRHPQSDEIAAAFGEVYYQQRQYDKAIEQYKKAIVLRPDSAVNHAGLARVSLDSNRLNEALKAGQEAVQFAPQVGQYHAILGLAYSYSRLNAQAEREFRTALALDPHNALALVQLGLRNQEGDPRTTDRTASLVFGQGFLYDPAISRDLLRGGVKTELAPEVGQHNNGLTLTHRDTGREGDLNFFGRLTRDADEGERPNADARTFNIRQDTTLALSPRTNLYFHLLHSRDKNGLPGAESSNVRDDRESFRFSQGILAMRHRIGARGYLWAGLFGNNQRDERTNPNRDTSFLFSPFRPIGGDDGLDPLRVTQQSDITKSTQPEVRLDLLLSRTPARPRILTFGVARPHTTELLTRDTAYPPEFPGSLGIWEYHGNFVTTLAYTQWAQRFNDRFSLTAQLRYQHSDEEITIPYVKLANQGSFGPDSQRFKGDELLPSMVVNYQLDKRTALRLLASRRTTDIVSSTLAPAETLLTTEGQTLPTGLPTTTKVMEIDVERYLSSADFLKVFVFRATSPAVNYDLSTFSNPSDFNGISSNLTLNEVRRMGAGVRYERRLGHNLFAQGTFVINRTTTDSAFAGQAPYHPKLSAGIGLNYIDAAGNKVGLLLNHVGSYFQDTGTTMDAERPRFSPKTYVDLMLAKEPSVHNEIFLQVTNLFGSRQVIFNDVPLGGRRVRVGFTRRF